MWKLQEFSQFRVTYPSVFVHFETNRHDEIMNKPILERKMIALVDSIDIFLILIFDSSPDSSK